MDQIGSPITLEVWQYIMLPVSGVIGFLLKILWDYVTTNQKEKDDAQDAKVEQLRSDIDVIRGNVSKVSSDTDAMVREFESQMFSRLDDVMKGIQGIDRRMVVFEANNKVAEEKIEENKQRVGILEARVSKAEERMSILENKLA